MGEPLTPSGGCLAGSDEVYIFSIYVFDILTFDILDTDIKKLVRGARGRGSLLNIYIVAGPHYVHTNFTKRVAVSGNSFLNIADVCIPRCS
jgi:hypothetical protein